jgi:hypothetical protein
VHPSKTLIGASVSLLALSAVLGVLNTKKTRGLRVQITQAGVARNAAEQLRITREKELKGRKHCGGQQHPVWRDPNKAANTEELARAQRKNDFRRSCVKTNQIEHS